MGVAGAGGEVVELVTTGIDARVDLILVDDVPVPTLIIVDGSVTVEIAGSGPAAARAAARIAIAATDLYLRVQCSREGTRR